MSKLLLLQPVAVLMLLTAFVTIWMFFTRVKAMVAFRVHPQKGQDTRKLRELLPHKVNQVANNYNHLFEQPVLFYAVCLALYLVVPLDMLTLYLAWGYVICRIVHTLIQAIWDKVMPRFTVFIISWCLLIALIVKFSWFVFNI